MKRMLAGLLILSKYEADSDTAAEHDVIYAGSIEPSKISTEDLKALDDNGWNWDETLECWYKFT